MFFQTHAPDETLAVKLKRAGADVTVNAKCSDSKPYFDLILEASYAAEPPCETGSCADKMDQARKLHTTGERRELVEPSVQIRLPNDSRAPQLPQAYYDFQKQAIEELGSSADALDRAAADLLRG